MKRILLFAVTNIAVLLVLSVIARLFGLDVYLVEHGGNLPSLLWLSAIFGFGGAFVSLALSKPTAKMAMGVKVITEPPTDRGAHRGFACAAVSDALHTRSIKCRPNR